MEIFCQNKKEQGAALALVLVMLIAFAVIGSATAGWIARQTTTSVDQSQLDQAFNAADAGVQYTQWLLSATGAALSPTALQASPPTETENYTLTDENDETVSSFTLDFLTADSDSLEIRSIGRDLARPEICQTVIATLQSTQSGDWGPVSYQRLPSYDCRPSECNDGIDNDGDGLSDLNDPGCADEDDSDESDGTSQCQDGSDNDGDGLVDLSDNGCVDFSDNTETGECQDGIDNDGDGIIDSNDPGCWTDVNDSGTYDATRLDESAATTQCQDGIDNDGDTLADFIGGDPGCTYYTDNDELGILQCDDGIDNDGNGDIDYPDDANCSSSFDDLEDVTPECQDGIDNDGDGQTDYADDPGCSDINDVSELGSNQCDDGIDNDGNGDIDYPDDAGCSEIADTIEAAQCNDGVDNDGDFWVDYPNDPDCSSALDNNEEATPIFFDDFEEIPYYTLLDSHTPDIGLSWTQVINFPINKQMLIDSSGFSFLRQQSTTSGAALYFANVSGGYSTADYQASVTRLFGIPSYAALVLALRATEDEMYALVYNDSVCEIHKKQSGSWSQLTSCTELTDSDDKITFGVVGNTLTVTKNDSTVIASYTDSVSPITSANEVALGAGEVVTGSGYFIWQYSSLLDLRVVPAITPPQCADGLDNDSDGLTDANDPGCWDTPGDSGSYNFGLNDESVASDKQCSDLIDNDGNGDIDYPADAGCADANDNFESISCNDGVDNDGDGQVDYPADPGCVSVNDLDELGAFLCDNGIDDDFDGDIDYPADSTCTSLTDNYEGSVGPIFSDTFTVSSNELLGAHVPDTGVGWLQQFSSSGADLTVYYVDDYLEPTSTVSNASVLYRAVVSGGYPTADYEVRSVAHRVSSGSNRTAMAARIQDSDNMYGVIFNSNSGQLYKKVAGTWTAMGVSFAGVSNDSNVILRVQGNTISFYDDGVQKSSVTDSSITSAGTAGVGFGGLPGMSGYGMHDWGIYNSMDDFQVQPI